MVMLPLRSSRSLYWEEEYFIKLTWESLDKNVKLSITTECLPLGKPLAKDWKQSPSAWLQCFAVTTKLVYTCIKLHFKMCLITSIIFIRLLLLFFKFSSLLLTCMMSLGKWHTPHQHLLALMFYSCTLCSVCCLQIKMTEVWCSFAKFGVWRSV